MSSKDWGLSNQTHGREWKQELSNKTEPDDVFYTQKAKVHMALEDMFEMYVDTREPDADDGWHGFWGYKNPDRE